MNCLSKILPPLCFLLIPTIAFGQEVEGDDLAAEFQLLEEEAVVESAARRRQPISLSPSAITLLTKQDLEASGARTIPEALRMVPNTNVYQVTPFWYEVGIRGGRGTSGIDTVPLFVDGRDATIEFLGFPTWTALPFSMDEVERIEVIRGPGSALYGANAFSGVVSVKTYEPGEGPEQSFSVRGGEIGYTELNARVSRRFGAFALAATAGMQTQDFWTERDNAELDVLRGRLVGKVDLGEKTSLVVEGGAYSASGRGRTGWGELEFHKLDNVYSAVRFKHDTLTVQAVYDRLDVDADINFDLTIDDVTFARIPPLLGDMNKVALLAQHAVEIPYNHFTYGAEYLLHFTDIEPFDPTEQSEHRYGIFLQDEINLAQILEDLFEAKPHGLFLTLGMRFDDNTSGPHEFSPRASLVWQLNAQHSFRLGYAHAFLKPLMLLVKLHVRLEDVANMNLDEMNWNPADDLKNESIDSLEAGYAGNFLGGRLQLYLDYAQLWIKNPITPEIDYDLVDYIEFGPIRIPDPTGPGLMITNEDDQLHGHVVELQGVVKPVDGLRVFANVSFRQLFTQKNRFEKYEPLWLAGCGADLAAGGWLAAVQAFFTHKHTSRMVNPPGGFDAEKHVYWLNNAWLVNARLAREITMGTVRMQAGVEVFNLLDQRFYEMAGLEMPNRSDWIAERLDRRIVVFLRGEI
jgi:outer membrane receptor protein involved in Fe transport